MSWGDDATRFLKRVMPWPASDNDAGYVNLHWNSISNSTQHGDPERPYWVGKPFRTAEALVGLAGFLIQQPNVRDLYFCTSLQAQSIKNKAGKQSALRSLQNSICSKVLFLDIDIKPPPKGYETQAEALTALGDFLKKFKYPFPNAIVNSGRGLHVYWVGEPRSHVEWQPRAEKLRSAAVQFGLRCDGQCTVDFSRILRVPETSNWKSSPPAKVTLLHLD